MSHARRRRNPRHKTPFDWWLASECAPFIRRVLKARTDADRTAVAREFADWLDARGDADGYAKWFRHPKLHWEVHDGGRWVSWGVHPWDNAGGGGIGARIDNFWWVCRYPTPRWTESAYCSELVGKWLDNRVDVEQYPWSRDVARRLGREAEWVKGVKDRAESVVRRRRMEAEREARERAEYERLKKKYEGG